jgi:hypothetical protein
MHCTTSSWQLHFLPCENGVKFHEQSEDYLSHGIFFCIVLVVIAHMTFMSAQKLCFPHCEPSSYLL